MTLLGEYTDAGALLAAQIQAGTAGLAITRAAAGSGYTEAQDAAMDNERQGLALSALSRDGATLTVPVRLLSAEAGSAYTLTEIGLFAAKAGGGELLYKIYRFDRGISISPDSSLNATFYLHDTVAAGRQAAVTVSVDGLINRADGQEIAETAIAAFAEGMLGGGGAWAETEDVISCTVAQLAAKVAGLPRHLLRNTRINVTGTAQLTAGIEVVGFYGPGQLSIIAQSPRILSRKWLRVDFNRLPRIVVQGFAFEETDAGGYFSFPEMSDPAISGGLTRVPGALVSVRGNSGHTILRDVNVSPFKTGVDSYMGVYVRGCTCDISDFDAYYRRYPMVANEGAHVVVRNIKTPRTTANNITNVLVSINGSTVTWPGPKTGMTSVWGTPANTLVNSGGKIFFGPATVEIAPLV